MALHDEKYLLATTFRGSGDGVATPVWVVRTADGAAAFATSSGSGKAKRLRRDPRIVLQPCNIRGRVRAGSEAVEVTGTILTSGPVYDEVQRLIDDKYGVMVPITKFADKLMHLRKPEPVPYHDIVIELEFPAG